MSWTLHRWVWLLEGPLFVGALPAGALNRCRLYVPPRAIWAALTAESAQAGANGFPDYRQRGKSLREHARFTYLYPAARVKGAWRAWLPDYVPDKGLVWRREDHAPTANEPVPDRQFRRWLIDARPGTAIDADSDTAAEASLRETECVMTHWRFGSPSQGEPIALVGYVFLKDMPASNLNATTTLFIGGDTRYGLGRMRRIEFTDTNTVFGLRAVLDGDSPLLIGQHLLAHGVCGRDLHGAIEALAWWDRSELEGNPLRSGSEARWAPGSRGCDAVEWGIDEAGIWHDSRVPHSHGNGVYSRA